MDGTPGTDPEAFGARPALDRCPVCGGPVERGFLVSGGLGWSREKPSRMWGPRGSIEPILRRGIGEEWFCSGQRCAACELYVLRRG